jgi:transmembrane sensor
MKEDISKIYYSELFKTYDTEDFVNDGFFRKLVLNEHGSDLKIKDLIEEIPEKKKAIMAASRIIAALKVPEQKLPSEKKHLSWLSIVERENRRKRIQFLKYAASVILISCLGGAALFYNLSGPTTRVFMADSTPVYENATLLLENGAEVLLSRGKSTEIKYSTDGKSLVIDDSLTLEKGMYQGVNKVIVPYGKRANLYLSDGTRVWLNSGSTLTYSSVFSGRTREVSLAGEAYFDVEKNPAMPFIVHTDSFDIRAVGTIFNIRSYKDADVINTTLIEGKVSVKFMGDAFSNEFMLHPSQKASMTKGINSIVISSVEDIENEISWIDGFFIFNNEDFGSVLRKISKFYNITIELKYRTKLTNIYGKLDLKENPEKVMEVLALLSGTSYSIEDNKYLFTD